MSITASRAEIPALLVSLAIDPVNEPSELTMSRSIELENRIAMNDAEAIQNIDTLREPSTFTCPDCHGAMWELRDQGFIRFRCVTGHAHTCESLMVQQSQAIDYLLQEARRVSHDQVALARYRGPISDSSMGAWVAAQLKEAERKEALLQEALLDENEVLASDLVGVS